MIATIIVLLMFVLLAAGMPVGFTLIASGALGILWIGGPSAMMGILASMPKDSASSYEFLAIPMFLLMA
ncbi:Tripartite ATP-independent transporter, DctM component, partial [Paracoccus pantotrophus]